MSLYTLFLKLLKRSISLVYVIFASAKTKLLRNLLNYEHNLCFTLFLLIINHKNLYKFYFFWLKINDIFFYKLMQTISLGIKLLKTDLVYFMMFSSERYSFYGSNALHCHCPSHCLIAIVWTSWISPNFNFLAAKAALIKWWFLI